MGEAEAKEVTEEETIDTEAEEVKEELDAEEEKPAEGEDETTEEDQEFEVVRESGESQTSTAPKQTGFRKRINKLNQKIDVANQERDSANSNNAVLEEKNKLLEIALEQARSGKIDSVNPPNPDDYDAGTLDPEFIKKKEAWTNARIDQRISEGIAKATKSTVETQTTNTKAIDLQKKQASHYERAEKLGVKDYETIEDKAIETLGLEFTNHIIEYFNDSQNILYYLGKNPKDAEVLRGLLDENLVLGVAEIGRLRSEIRVRPKKQTTPNPDTELEGGVPKNATANDRKLDKLREEASKTGDMTKLIAFKRELKAKGKT